MSSTYCQKCHEMIWDKYQGMINGSYEKRDNTGIYSVCGSCGDNKLLFTIQEHEKLEKIIKEKKT